MKKCAIFIAIGLSSCFVNPSGRIIFYDFYKTKNEVEKALIDNVGKDTSCNNCSSWITISQVDGFENIYVDFKDSPREEYLLQFSCDSADWNHSPNSRLAFKGVNYGEGWQFRRDLSSKEQKRIQLRLENEILSKIPYSYTKSDETGTCRGM